MNDDLNIRAAKVLGWVYEYGFWRNADGEEYDPEAYELKFTTSYDWAMLGVKIISAKALHEKFYDKFWSQGSTSDTYYIYEGTPAQITQAWVSVLEAAQ
mgnify:CR=1 FL=1|tara:strand:- start:263 stop:559 length:297 start_codon:yes stop_codon:yes gene_type:complete